MVKLMNHVKEGNHHLFFVNDEDHHELVWWALQQRMYPIPCYSGSPTDDETNEEIEGVWYCPNIDEDGFEWHFVNRANHAMLFKLKVA